jgi:hypothetical protein
MTYFQIKFANRSGVPISKVFRTREQAKQDAKRVLGLLEDGDLESKIAITPVPKKKQSCLTAPIS